jgi:hypothetical protein
MVSICSGLYLFFIYEQFYFQLSHFIISSMHNCDIAALIFARVSEFCGLLCFHLSGPGFLL